MNKYWFKKRKGVKSKDQGWGWPPISWEGWLLVIIILSIIAISTVAFFGQDSATSTDSALAYGMIFVGTVVGSICVGVLISRSKTRR